MPIYEFHCDDCGRDSEILVRSKNEKTECPHCGSAKLAKKFSTFAAASASSSAPAPKKVRSAGHSCGGGCGCH